MVRIAVTGSAGFLGRQVVDELVGRGYAVRGLDSVGRTDFSLNVERRTVDLREAHAARDALADCDGIVHLAGYPRVGWLSPTEVFATNTTITFAVVQAALDLGIRLIAYGSSVSVLGYPFFTQQVTPEYLPIDEGAATLAQDAYGLSKAVGEQIIDAAVAQAGGALAAVSLRMPWLQSPASFWKDIPSSQVDGSDARNLFAYIDTRDAASAITAVFARKRSGHTRLLVAADATFSEVPSAWLATEHFPGVPVRNELTGTRSLIDSSAAQGILGWTPRWSWRSYAKQGVR